MAFTQDQYNKLCDAIAQGALKVKYADKEVDYRSLDEMLRIKGIMEQQLGVNTAGSNRKVTTTYRSGLNNANPLPDNW